MLAGTLSRSRNASSNTGKALPNRGGGGGHVAQINGLVEGVLLHNLDPEVTVEDLTIVLQQNMHIKTLTQVYKMSSSRGLTEDTSFALHLQNADDLIDKFNDPNRECDGRQLRAERVLSRTEPAIATSNTSSKAPKSYSHTAKDEVPAPISPPTSDASDSSETLASTSSSPALQSVHVIKDIYPFVGGGTARGINHDNSRSGSSRVVIPARDSVSTRNRGRAGPGGRNASTRASCPPRARGTARIGIKPDFLEIRAPSPLSIKPPPSKESPEVTREKTTSQETTSVANESGTEEQQTRNAEKTVAPNNALKSTVPPTASEDQNVNNEQVSTISGQRVDEATSNTRLPGFIPGPGAFIGDVREGTLPTKVASVPFVASIATAVEGSVHSSTIAYETRGLTETEQRHDNITSPDGPEGYSWVTHNGWAYPESNSLYDQHVLPLYGPVGHSEGSNTIQHHRTPSIESIHTAGVRLDKARTALRATAQPFALATAHVNSRSREVRAHNHTQNSTPHQSLAISLRPAAISFVPSLSYNNGTPSIFCNSRATPFMPISMNPVENTKKPTRPFPAYFPVNFVNLLDQAGMCSVEDARMTLQDTETVFNFVKELAEQVPDTLHCFVMEFSLASKLCKVLSFLPFESKIVTAIQPPMELADLTPLSTYCNPTCLEVLSWAGLNFVQEAQELLNIPETVPIFVQELAKRRPDALSSFRATFDLRSRLNRIIG